MKPFLDYYSKKLQHLQKITFPSGKFVLVTFQEKLWISIVFPRNMGNNFLCVIL